jgi:hypothetical protein
VRGGRVICSGVCIDLEVYVTVCWLYVIVCAMLASRHLNGEVHNLVLVDVVLFWSVLRFGGR